MDSQILLLLLLLPVCPALHVEAADKQRAAGPTARPFGLPTLPPLPQVATIPPLPTVPSLPALPAPAVPAVPAIVPQFLDVFSDGLSKVSTALRGPNPLSSLAPFLRPSRGRQPTKAKSSEPENKA